MKTVWKHKYQSNQRLFVIGVDMENRSAEDIARDAAQQIAKITDALIAKQNQEREIKKKMLRKYFCMSR